MKNWFKKNKALVSILLTISLTSAGVPAYLAKPAADGITTGIEQHVETAD